MWIGATTFGHRALRTVPFAIVVALLTYTGQSRAQVPGPVQVQGELSAELTPLEPASIEPSALAARLAAQLAGGQSGARQSGTRRPETRRPETRRPVIVLFDVRSAEEFAVSHISGAINVSPEMPVEAFLRAFAPTVVGADVVFYCTVGDRSSTFALPVMDSLLQGGARRVSTLRAGLVGWLYEGSGVVDAAGPTHLIYPFAADIASLLKPPMLPSLTPRPRP
jgi:rhodanese-related sulfurtransferase